MAPDIALLCGLRAAPTARSRDLQVIRVSAKCFPADLGLGMMECVFSRLCVQFFFFQLRVVTSVPSRRGRPTG
jgi:hypothetical protein